MGMDGVLGASFPVFLCLTVLLFGGCAFMTGQALAEGWRSVWAVVAYSLLLGAGDRFLVFGLFGGPLFSLYGFAVHTGVIGAVAMLAFSVARARRMVSQYPWLYERTGAFTWREKSPHAGL
jgi:hypothetical protein